MMLSTFRITLAAVAITSTLAGCGDDTTSNDDGTGGTGGEGGMTAGFGEADVVQAYESFTSSGFTKISVAPTDSQHALADQVVVWAANDIADEYKAIDPEDTTATAGPFAEGSIIIKQHYVGGAPDGSALVMAKFAEGFNPGAADWWWGRFNAAGELKDNGVVDFCISCHEGNGFARTDFVAGVPTSNK